MSSNNTEDLRAKWIDRLRDRALSLVYRHAAVDDDTGIRRLDLDGMAIVLRTVSGSKRTVRTLTIWVSKRVGGGVSLDKPLVLQWTGDEAPLVISYRAGPWERKLMEHTP
jgi:hypothetical protein